MATRAKRANPPPRIFRTTNSHARLCAGSSARSIRLSRGRIRSAHVHKARYHRTLSLALPHLRAPLLGAQVIKATLLRKGPGIILRRREFASLGCVIASFGATPLSRFSGMYMQMDGYSKRENAQGCESRIKPFRKTQSMRSLGIHSGV